MVRLSSIIMEHKVASPHQRYLTNNELKIVLALIDASDEKWQHLKEGLSDIPVFEMNDGGMGSLMFYQHEFGDRMLGGAIIEATFTDEDNVPVSLALNVDDKNRLFELDSWKVDFSQLIRLPSPDKLSFDK